MKMIPMSRAKMPKMISRASMVSRGHTSRMIPKAIPTIPLNSIYVQLRTINEPTMTIPPFSVRIGLSLALDSTTGSPPACTAVLPVVQP